MSGILAAAIAFVVSDWSKPRVAVVMGSLGAVALVVLLAEQIAGGARSLD
jgi:type IV secretory pathway TrbD component